MVVQQHVLNWLYSVLTSVWALVSRDRRSKDVQANMELMHQEYHDVNRTYNDVAQALSQYPSLSPRTDVHSMSHMHIDQCYHGMELS
jgi:ESCRT-I complex subunit TSG101